MLENKHYGRQVILSLFITVFLLIGLVYFSVKFFVPMYQINQDQIYAVLIRIFPILIGLVMIEIGVMIARRRDEDYVDEVDKLPPNAYDKPLYTLPGDDPSHLHSDEMTYGHVKVTNDLTDQDFGLVSSGEIEPVVQVKEEFTPVSGISPMSGIAPLGALGMSQSYEAEPEVHTASYDTGFASILSLELENAIAMDYDLTLLLIDVKEGPKVPISNKLIIQSGELAYCYLLDDGLISMVLPFYNETEADAFLKNMVKNCESEFRGCLLKIGSASRIGRSVDGDFLYHEAEQKLKDELKDED
jgi:hypothetical protein